MPGARREAHCQPGSCWLTVQTARKAAGPGRERRPNLIKYAPQVHLERVFHSGSVQAPSTDEQMLAQIADVCPWYVVSGPPTAQRQAAALPEPACNTGGRTDLPARYAGQGLARPDAGLGDTVHESGAQLCITAGAAMDLIER
jgi:hypothetical protein